MHLEISLLYQPCVHVAIAPVTRGLTRTVYMIYALYMTAYMVNFLPKKYTHCILMYIPYRLYITAQKYRFLPCGVTARTKNIYLFWGCGIEKRGFLAYFEACQAKTPVRGWCKLNISRVRG